MCFSYKHFVITYDDVLLLKKCAKIRVGLTHFHKNDRNMKKHDCRINTHSFQWLWQSIYVGQYGGDKILS